MSKARALTSFANVVLLPLGTFSLFVGGWEAIVRGFNINKIVLPAPSAIAL